MHFIGRLIVVWTGREGASAGLNSERTQWSLACGPLHLRAWASNGNLVTHRPCQGEGGQSGCQVFSCNPGQFRRLPGLHPFKDEWYSTA